MEVQELSLSRERYVIYQWTFFFNDLTDSIDRYFTSFMGCLDTLMHLLFAIPCGVIPGKGGDFVKDPMKVLKLLLLNTGTEQSKLTNSMYQKYSK